MKKIAQGEIKRVKERARQQSHLFPNSTVPRKNPKRVKKKISHLNEP